MELSKTVAHCNLWCKINQQDYSNQQGQCEKVIYIILYVIASLTLIFLMIDLLVYSVHATLNRKFLNRILDESAADPTIVEDTIKKYATQWGLVDPFVKDSKLQNKNIKTVLDVGCGIGLTIQGILERMPEVKKIRGLDLDEGAIYDAKNNINSAAVGDKKVELETANIVDLSTFGLKGENDLVICTDVLQYLSPLNMLKTLNKIKRCVSQNGFFIGSLLIIPSGANSVKHLTTYKSDLPKIYIESMLRLFGFTLIDTKIESDWLDNGRNCKYSFLAQKTTQVKEIELHEVHSKV